MDFTTILVAVIGSGVFNTLLGYILSARERRKSRNEEVNKSLRLLMKDRLRFLCMHYVRQGWIYEDELEDIISMHNCYHDDLGGNGYLDELMRRTKNLEVRGIGGK